MQFTKRLREPIKRGEVTISIRIWQSPKVKAGGRYPLSPGHIEVTSIREIRLQDVTPAMARESGFEGLVDLLKVAKHGPGDRVFLVAFDYHDAPVPVAAAAAAKPGRSPSAPSRSAPRPRSSPSTRATSARAARKPRG